MNTPAAHSSAGRRQAKPAWTWLLPAAMLLAAAVIPLLVWYAVNAILNSTDGQIDTAVTDPAAPGYQVLVVPSPSHMVLGVDAAGDLSTVMITGLASNDLGGTVLLIAPETFANSTDRTLADVYRDEGPDAARLAVATLLDINTDDYTVLDVTGWEQMVNPVGPISVDNPVALESNADGQALAISFPSGNIAVEAAQTSLFLSGLNDDESPLGRLARQEAFLRAWIATITASSDPSAIPGELDDGIGRMLQGLANGPSSIEVAEGTATVIDGERPAVQVDLGKLRSAVAKIVPFPLPVVEGARPTVRLLDGVGGVDVASLYSPELVLAGAQIIVIGNTTEFGVGRTEVVYHDARFEAQANAFGQQLGGALVTFEARPDGPLDVTIVIGEDHSKAVG